MDWSNPFLVAIGAVLLAMACMYLGQLIYHQIRERAMRRDDRARRRMRKLRQLPVEARKCDSETSSGRSMR